MLESHSSASGASGESSLKAAQYITTSPLSGGLWSRLNSVLRKREDLLNEILERRNVESHIRWLLLAIVLFSTAYGMTMGATTLREDLQRGFLQVISSAIKVPGLYVLSVLVCYPVLFIVIVLMGSKLDFSQTLALILVALSLNSILLISCAPIVLFFIVTGSDYEFIKLLHVLIFGFSGGWAMMALWQGLAALCEKSDLYPKKALRILQIWVLVFGFVGTQMAWTLRPFVGNPGMEFQVFRNQEGNFYKAIWASVKQLTN